MTQIIGFSGRKQSGKGTLCDFVTKNADALFATPKQLAEYATLPDCFKTGVIRVQTYSMAGALKEFCVNVLGLTKEQCYGSDADKNTPTRYKWEDLPHYPHLLENIRRVERAKAMAEYRALPWWARLVEWWLGTVETNVENRVALAAPTGPMTARQVLQEFGTGIIRRMWADAWNQACLRAIARDQPGIALIDDIRFPDEAAAVMGAGGKVIRLHRAPHIADEHPSETAMDGYSGYSAELANNVLDVHGSCVALVEILKNLGVVSGQVKLTDLVIPGGPMPNLVDASSVCDGEPGFITFVSDEPRKSIFGWAENGYAITDTITPKHDNGEQG